MMSKSSRRTKAGKIWKHLWPVIITVVSVIILMFFGIYYASEMKEIALKMKEIGIQESVNKEEVSILTEQYLYAYKQSLMILIAMRIASIPACIWLLYHFIRRFIWFFKNKTGKALED